MGREKRKADGTFNGSEPNPTNAPTPEPQIPVQHIEQNNNATTQTVQFNRMAERLREIPYTHYDERHGYLTISGGLPLDTKTELAANIMDNITNGEPLPQPTPELESRAETLLHPMTIDKHYVLQQANRTQLLNRKITNSTNHIYMTEQDEPETFLYCGYIIEVEGEDYENPHNPEAESHEPGWQPSSFTVSIYDHKDDLVGRLSQWRNTKNLTEGVRQLLTHHGNHLVDGISTYS